MTIRTRDLDPNFWREVAAEMEGEAISRCFACGTCTAGCPVREIESRYNPRRIIRMVLLGMREEVLNSDFIWLCSTCYTCYDRCPQGVRLTDVMTALKNIAVREGHVHPSFREQARLVLAHGRLYEVEDFDNRKREKMGLPPVRKAIEEVREVVDDPVLEEVVAE